MLWILTSLALATLFAWRPFIGQSDGRALERFYLGDPVDGLRRTSISTASSARSAARQRIPTSAKPQVAAAIKVIVAMASMGGSLIGDGSCPQCRRSSKAQGAYDLSHLHGEATFGDWG
jgi:hypothetical protein